MKNADVLAGIVLIGALLWVTIKPHTFDALFRQQDECFTQRIQSTPTEPTILFGCGRDPHTYIGIKKVKVVHKDLAEVLTFVELSTDTAPQCQKTPPTFFSPPDEYTYSSIKIGEIYRWEGITYCFKKPHVYTTTIFTDSDNFLTALSHERHVTFQHGEEHATFFLPDIAKVIQKFYQLARRAKLGNQPKKYIAF